MDPPPTLRFGPFLLDPADARLWRGEEVVPLGSRAFAVLCRLAGRPGRLTSKEELFEAAWEGRAVSDGALTTAIHEIRRALGDAPGDPEYVQTVYGRGYRFVAPVEAPPSPVAAPAASLRPLAGRHRAWDELAGWAEEAIAGDRRVVFVAGEAGVGKTALCEAFLERLGAERGLLVARGRCVESYGRGEAYLPLLEALGRLLRSGAPSDLAEILERRAPSWLAHLSPPEDGAETERGGGPATPARMLREMAEALETFAARHPLALLLEDLHWSDTPTLSWLDYLARRPDPARLLVLATYRPVEVAVHAHPLRGVVSEIVRQPAGRELVLDDLSGADVDEYVGLRFPGLAGAAEVALTLHARTGGHPLFLVTLADELVRRGVLVPAGADAWRIEDATDPIETVIPETLADYVDERLERLPEPDRRLLESAAVAGSSFDAVVVAAAVGEPSVEVEERCALWSRRGELLETEPASTYPGGAVSARFGFRHALLHEIVLRRVPSGRRAALHGKIARALATLHAGRPSGAAAEIAVHFEAGGDPGAAAAYRLRAARTASGRSAYDEAARHAEHGLRLLGDTIDGASGDLEAELHLARGLALSASRGWASPEAAASFRRAHEICGESGDEDRGLLALWGTISVAIVTGGLEEAHRGSMELLTDARDHGSHVFELAAQMELGVVAFERGELEAARDRLAEAAALYDRARHAEHLTLLGVDFGVFTLAFDAHRAWLAGDEAESATSDAAALRLASALGHPFSRAVATAYSAALHLLRRDPPAARRRADEALALCTEHGFAYYLDWARAVRGWARAASDGVSPADRESALVELRQAIDSLRANVWWRLVPLFEARLAERLGASGRPDAAAAAIDRAREAISESGAAVWETEVARAAGDPVAGSGGEGAGLY